MRKNLLIWTRTAAMLLLATLFANTAWAENPMTIHLTEEFNNHWKVVLLYGDEKVELIGADAQANGETGNLTLPYTGQAIKPEVKVYFRRVEGNNFHEIPSNHYEVSYENNINATTEAKVIITTISSNGEVFTLLNDDNSVYGNPEDPYYQFKIKTAERVEKLFIIASTTEEVTIDALTQNDAGEYLIATIDDWNALAAYVAAGNDCAGLTFKMTDDIGTNDAPVTTMMGKDKDNRFAGTFDGGDNTLTVALNSSSNPENKYCAPFAFTQCATIMNLHVAGTITTTGQFAAGLVGTTGPDNNQTKGKCTIENCQVSVEIVSNYVQSGSKYANHGGFIGVAEGIATITNSWFDGKFSGLDYKYSAGFIGQNKAKMANNVTTTLTNCLFNPQSLGDLDTTGSCEFVHDLRAEHSHTLINCYWVTHFGEVENSQGQKVVTELSEAVADAINTAVEENGTEVGFYVKTLGEADVPDGNTYYIVKHHPTWMDLKNELEAGHDFLLNGNLEAGADDESIVIPGEISGDEVTVPAGANVKLTLGTSVLDRNLALTEAKDGGFVIKVEEGATLTIEGGTITGGHNTLDGGGIYNAGTLHLIGTTITGNYSAGNGAGIYNTGTLTIDGATITDNYCTIKNGKGAGVYVAQNSTFSVKGNAQINENYCKYQDPTIKQDPTNVFLNNAVVSIAGPLTESSIYVGGTDDVVASFADLEKVGDLNALSNSFKQDGNADMKAYVDGAKKQVRWNTSGKTPLNTPGIFKLDYWKYPENSSEQLSEFSPTYNGSAFEPYVSISASTNFPPDETDLIPGFLIPDYCVISGYSNNTDAGTAYVIISAKEGENNPVIGSATIPFTIKPRPITITANDQTVTYGESFSTEVNDETVTVGGDRLVSGHTLSLTLTESGNEMVPSDIVIKSGETDVTANYAITPVNGALTMTKKPITITAINQEVTYGEAILQGTAYVTVTNTDASITTAPLVGAQTLTAITLTPSTTDATTSGTITPSEAVIKDGETDMTANYDITYVAGTLTVSPISAAVVVTITGANNTTDFDGEEHSVSGYTATASNPLYNVNNSFSFSTTFAAFAARTNAGTTTMGLKEEMFENTNPNFTNVSFTVVDGYQTINSIDVTVTIKGKTMEAVYRDEYYTVWGYDVEIDNPLYLKSYFTGPAQQDVYAGSKEEGTTPMKNLKANLFTNNKPEDFNVTFDIKNGWLKIYYYEATLADDADNSEVIRDLTNPLKYGGIANVTLKRTFVKDNTWYTICLPFDVTIADSPLAGADVREMSDASLNGGKITLDFTENSLTKMEAGKAYLIKWAEGEDLVNPKFKEAKFNELEEDEELIMEKPFELGNGKSIMFKGTFAPISFEEDNNSVLLVGDNNSLYYPQATASLGAQRALFQLEGFEAGDPAATDAPAFVLNFGDATGILDLNDLKDFNDLNATYYDLSGRRVAQPTKGVYIVNGKKVIIK